ncbi:MAG: DUF5675 family protein [Balneola sp.]
MKLTLVTYSPGKDDSLGIMFIDDQAHSFTLEDEERLIKVPGETRIPRDTYEIKLRTYGGFHERYLERFGPEFHKGMLELIDVPGFTDILIHILNDEKETDGCIGVGDGAFINRRKKGSLRDSTSAYKDLYQQVANELLDGNRVFIELTDNLTNLIKEPRWENQGL